jgi:hypothetical protein
MRITKRIVDPITFQQRIGVEFIPRIEDSCMDDTLGASASYFPPKDAIALTRAIKPKTPKSPPSSSRMPKTSDSPPTSPRTTLLSPLHTPRSAGGRRRSLTSTEQMPKLVENSFSELEGSLENLTSPLESMAERSIAVEKTMMGAKGVQFAGEDDINDISRLNESMLADMFYRSEELANFRYEAFMHEAGLDVEDYKQLDEGK